MLRRILGLFIILGSIVKALLLVVPCLVMFLIGRVRFYMAGYTTEQQVNYVTKMYFGKDSAADITFDELNEVIDENDDSFFGIPSLCVHGFVSTVRSFAIGICMLLGGTEEDVTELRDFLK
jgi:hypothetical protein